jgi:hypothetical protein
MTQTQRADGWEVKKKRNTLRRKQQDRIDELIKDYNKTVYHPALRELQEECEKATGHKPTATIGSFGPGQTYCDYCGKMLPEVEPNDYYHLPF